MCTETFNTGNYVNLQLGKLYFPIMNSTFECVSVESNLALNKAKECPTLQEQMSLLGPSSCVTGHLREAGL